MDHVFLYLRTLKRSRKWSFLEDCITLYFVWLFRSKGRVMEPDLRPITEKFFSQLKPGSKISHYHIQTLLAFIDTSYKNLKRLIERAKFIEQTLSLEEFEWNVFTTLIRSSNYSQRVNFTNTDSFSHRDFYCMTVIQTTCYRKLGGYL